MPYAIREATAALVGTIKRCKEFLRAFAPSEAPTPPSFMATRNATVSLYVPPKFCTIGPTRGIASIKSFIVVLVAA